MSKKKEFMNMLEEMAANTVSFTYKGNTYSITDGKIQCTELMKPVKLDLVKAQCDFLDLCKAFMPLIDITCVDDTGVYYVSPEGVSDE